jgi:DNA replication and repair protein RecF
MTLTRLSLSNLRSYGDALIVPGPGFVVLTGENGAGKTNVLEAISLLVPGRGLRGAKLGEVAREDGPGGFAVSGRLGDVELGTGTIATAPERRLVRINGASASANALSEWLSVIWITPAMDRLFSDSAGERRRFLDRLVLALEPGHAHHAARYEAAMRQRNRLLGAEERPDPDWLSALEAQMAEHGSEVAAARERMLGQLQRVIAQSADGPFAKAGLSLAGWQDAGATAKELAQGRQRDAAAGRTLAGPHRSDLSVTHIAKDQPAARCSTGEQKALLLGIVLAHADLVAAQVGRRPILLLDEITAHLDPVRRASLFAQLAAGGGQVWMTGTEPGLGDGASWFDVANGTINPYASSSTSQ